MEKLASLPWPRGLCFADDLLWALARGRPRKPGGPDPNIDDKAGTIYRVSTEDGGVSEIHAPSDPPFRLWDRRTPNHLDIETDRPYAGLAWHEKSRNFFVCGFSGIDRPTETVEFRKNATDAVLRFDTRLDRWFEVERHDGSVVPDSTRRSLTTSWIENDHFPSDRRGVPAGWLNGPDGLLVHRDSLYVVGKDNHSLVVYDLIPLVADYEHGPLTGEVLRKDNKEVRLPDGMSSLFEGPSSLATDGTHIFVGLRTTNVVLRFPLSGPFEEAAIVAQLPDGVELIDLALGESGDLYVSSKHRRIWNAGVPDPTSPYVADDRNVYAVLPGNCSNIALGANDQLYACCNIDKGAIFRQALSPARA